MNNSKITLNYYEKEYKNKEFKKKGLR